MIPVSLSSLHDEENDIQLCHQEDDEDDENVECECEHGQGNLSPPSTTASTSQWPLVSRYDSLGTAHHKISRCVVLSKHVPVNIVSDHPAHLEHVGRTYSLILYFAIHDHRT